MHRKSTTHPIHQTLMALHTERRRLLFVLESNSITEGDIERLKISLSENRGATRALLAYLHDDVLTMPMPIDGEARA